MPKTSRFEVIGIPYGTRLHYIVLSGDEIHVWIATKPSSRAGPYAHWQGTYLRFEPNGRVTRVTHDDAYTIDEVLEIKGADDGH